ncbi:ABC transporter G family member 39 [Euphorbia peplus]|nr:ABC transporter G family member 39 [Euphorbia peplus]
MQQMPVWWRWYYWANPVSWTIYEVITSQIGDKMSMLEILGSEPMPVNVYLEKVFGYKHDFLVYVVIAQLGWVLIFFFIFTASIIFLNFQRR